jgi:hypothetical protein
MALIIDPDFLNQGTEVTIDTTGKTISLNEAGNLSADGVTLQALYSFLKEEWKDDAALIPFPFPMVAITPEQFEFVDDWTPANDATRKLIRTGGWSEVDSSGTTTRIYSGVVTLGAIGGSNTVYYAFENDTVSTEFTYSGPVNEPVQIFGDASNGDFDNSSDILSLYVRTQGQQYGLITTTEIGVSSLINKVERFPLSESEDLKIEASDSDITTNAPYTGMSITFYDTAQSRTIGGTGYDFGVVIDGNNGTAEQIYEYVQYQLRQDSDINAGTGTVNGLLTDALLQFTGDNLSTLSVDNPIGGGSGVYIDNFNSNDTNRLTFTDNTSTAREFPFVSAGTISFNANLVNDADAVYRMFFTTNPAGDYGTADAVLVEDSNGDPISGSVGGASSVSFDFDYDGNTQGGRTAGTDADVTIVAIGLEVAQYVVATGTITRDVGINFTLVSTLERNFTNPV